MTLKEANELLHKVPWKTQECMQKDCWCSLIVPLEPIPYTDHHGELDEEGVYVIGAGAISKEFAQQIVDEHNQIILLKNPLP